ncbi:hypothetical protein EJK54_0111 [Moraxella catarrhalis]|uniref:Uncharacterized protein n=1 Tax=Moraxella catarrhalis TaxID=480 RepID=A0ABY0BHR1_MORCA|nr:hypothetical protein EJK54_0111 [Moraxella catarrhalis]
MLFWLIYQMIFMRLYHKITKAKHVNRIHTPNLKNCYKNKILLILFGKDLLKIR